MTVVGLSGYCLMRTSLTLQAQSDVWCQVCSSRLTTEHCQDTWSCRRIPHGERLQIHQRVADRYRGFGPLSLAKRYAYQQEICRRTYCDGIIRAYADHREVKWKHSLLYVAIKKFRRQKSRPSTYINLAAACFKTKKIACRLIKKEKDSRYVL